MIPHKNYIHEMLMLILCANTLQVLTQKESKRVTQNKHKWNVSHFSFAP